MRKSKSLIIVALMLLIGSPAVASVANEPISETTIATVSEEEVLIERLEQIKETDKSSLSRIEKKTLRKEVKSIKKELKRMGSGVYISSGAVIIILLLIILL